MAFVQLLVTSLALYIIPGFVLSRFLKGSYRNNVFVWVFLSFILVPFLYFFLVFLKQVHLFAFVGTELVLILGTFFIAPSIDSNEVLKTGRSFITQPRVRVLTLGVLGLFFLSLILPRIGLWQDYLPVGDDKPRVGQVLSIAESSDFPMHFRLPTTEMSIYFYNMVQPGLLMRFTDNMIRANQAWFIHLVITYILFGWCIYHISRYFARSSVEQFAMVTALTFFSGLEYYLARIRGVELGHLEWWNDWFFPNLPIHMQISQPYTASFWVTQHVFPTYLIFFIFMLMQSTQIKKPAVWLALSLLIAAILGNSAFVFLSFGIAYGLYYLIRILLRKESLRDVLIRNIVIGGVAGVLSVGVLYILAISGKQDYFLLQTTSFFFVPNGGIGKLINLALTIPFYLFVELGIELFVFGYFLYLFVKKRLYNEPVLFLYLLTLPFFLIFVFRAKGDDNFSMRGTLAGLVVLAIFFGWFVGILKQKVRPQAKMWVMGSLLAVSLLMLPSTLWELQARLRDQYGYKDPSLTLLDTTLPLHSLVFVDLPAGLSEAHIDQSNNMYEYLSDLGHRFTFKPVKYFNISDIEYTSQEAKNTYQLYTFGNLEEVQKLLAEEPGLDPFHAYYLSSRSLPLHKIGVGDYWLYILR